MLQILKSTFDQTLTNQPINSKFFESQGKLFILIYVFDVVHVDLYMEYVRNTLYVEIPLNANEIMW